MKSIKTDVVIVGAGPAGCSCAYFLSKSGVNVLLLDKDGFPRDKICGDGIFPRAIVILQQMGLGDWLKGFFRISGIRTFSPDGSSVEAKLEESLSFPVKHGYTIPRHTLDNKLCETAVSAGATFHQMEIKSPLWKGKRAAGVVGVRDGKETHIQAKLVISADGSLRSFSTKLAGQRVDPTAVALRAYFENVRNMDQCLNIFLTEDLKRGYAWIFPTSKTTANVGVGAYLSRQSQRELSMLNLFRRFVQSQRNSKVADLSQAHQISNVKGAPLQTNFGRIKSVVNGALIVGDAAGLVNPVNGEGISFSLESGKLASCTALSALERDNFSSQALQAYSRDLTRRYFLDWKMGSLFALVLRYPIMRNRIVKKADKDKELRNVFFGITASLVRPHKFFSPKILLKLLL